MGLLPDTQNCRCAYAGNAGNVFPVTAGKRSRHASRHVCHARAVMHAGIANLWFPLKSAAGENDPGIPGACTTCNYTYLVRGPWTLTNVRCLIAVMRYVCYAMWVTFHSCHLRCIMVVWWLFGVRTYTTALRIYSGRCTTEVPEGNET